MKRIAILQSNYIPWKGYFDLIASVDEFVLYDDMQFTRRDWRNRNLIKTPNGLKWLTIPVQVKGKYHQKICETQVESATWAAEHWRSIEANYRRAPHFRSEADWLSALYLGPHPDDLSGINRAFLTAICKRLQIGAQVTQSSDYHLAEERSERLASICEQAGAAVYVSGPAARDYLDESVFHQRGIAVEWFDYIGYPAYPQLWGPFEHGVTVLDLLFNTGASAAEYLKVAR